MSNLKSFTMLLIITGLVVGGCETSRPGATISAYSPQQVPVNHAAPESGVFVLWQSQKLVPSETTPRRSAKNRAQSFHVEIEQVYVQRGSPIGFQSQQGELIGIAGPTSIHLQPARYTWQRQKNSPDADIRRKNIGTIITAVVAVIVLAGIAVAILHFNRHHDLITPLLNSDCN